jgi:glycosyltransferase involved in cell wall biosynthesis
MDRAESPTVSVIIPAYNRAHLVGRAIQSVLSQAYRSLEVIVVDDGSTDNTEEIVTDFDDERIKYIRHDQNRGGAAARNTGIAFAAGEYIAFLDSDDAWLPDKLGKQVKAFEESDPQVGVIYTGCSVLSQNGEALVDYKAPRLRGEVLKKLLVSNRIVAGGSSALVKREHVQEIGGFDESLASCQDWDLWLRLARICKFDFVDAPLVRVYMHGDQITTHDDAWAGGLERLLQKHSVLFGRDRRLLSNWQRYLGSKYCRSGNLERGRFWFLRSLSTNLLNLRSYIYFVISLLGSRAFVRLAMLRSRNDPFVKVPPRDPHTGGE